MKCKNSRCEHTPFDLVFKKEIVKAHGAEVLTVTKQFTHVSVAGMKLDTIALELLLEL